MKSLKSMMDSCLEKITGKHGFVRLEDFVNSDELSAKFISSLSDGFDFEMPSSHSPVYKVAQSRARHSSITFLMGMVFEEFGALMQKIETMFSLNDTKQKYALWTLTSLNHDRGYTSDRLGNPKLDFEKSFGYNLLLDSYENTKLQKLTTINATPPHTMAYTYDEIRRYDQYARDYHSREEGQERIDHGILGGQILFDELIKRYVSTGKISEFDWLQLRCSALTIAQHNIFKSPSAKDDEHYRKFSLDRLLSKSAFRISSATPLLLLLSLVDTVECVKRFSQSETDKKYLQTLTVLQSIQAEVSRDQITLDFSQLRKEIEQKGDLALLNSYNGYLDSLTKFSTWTTLSGTRINDIVILGFEEGDPMEIKVAS